MWTRRLINTSKDEGIGDLKNGVARRVVGRMCMRRRKLVVAPLPLPLTVRVNVPAQPRGCRRCVDPGLGGGQGAAGGEEREEREGTNVAAGGSALPLWASSSVALAPMVRRVPGCLVSRSLWGGMCKKSERKAWSMALSQGVGVEVRLKTLFNGQGWRRQALMQCGPHWLFACLLPPSHPCNATLFTNHTHKPMPTGVW